MYICIYRERYVYGQSLCGDCIISPTIISRKPLNLKKERNKKKKKKKEKKKRNL